MTQEIWKPVIGYEGFYEVSNKGRVRSLDREITQAGKGGTQFTRRFKGKEIKSAPQVGGYLKTRLSKYGKRANPLVHRVVLEAFVGPCPEGMETRHLDSDPTNNCLENLVWGTVEENRRDTANLGNHPSQKRKVCPRGHKLEAPNLVKSSPHRRCRACTQAHHYLYSRKLRDEELLQRIADEKYEDICSVRTSCEYAV